MIDKFKDHDLLEGKDAAGVPASPEHQDGSALSE
jgi:hypothetical protein